MPRGKKIHTPETWTIGTEVPAEAIDCLINHAEGEELAHEVINNWDPQSKANLVGYILQRRMNRFLEAPPAVGEDTLRPPIGLLPATTINPEDPDNAEARPHSD